MRPPLNPDYTMAPGPGAYDSRGLGKKFFNKTQSSFGTSVRPSLSQTTATPGPGQYETGRQTVTKSERNENGKFLLTDVHGGPKYSFAGKREVKNRRGEFRSPGPAEYNVYYDFNQKSGN
jgi:hypothetical protein